MKAAPDCWQERKSGRQLWENHLMVAAGTERRMTQHFRPGVFPKETHIDLNQALM